MPDYVLRVLTPEQGDARYEPASGALKFVVSPELQMQLVLNPNNRFTLEKQTSTPNWRVKIDSEGSAAGTIYGGAVTTVEMSQIVYDWTFDTSGKWMVVGQDAQNRILIVNAYNQNIIYAMNPTVGSGNLTAVGSRASTNPPSRKLRVTWTTTDIVIDAEVSGAWQSWVTISKSSIGAVKDVGGVVNGSSNSTIQGQVMAVNIPFYKPKTLPPTGGRVLDYSTISQTPIIGSSDMLLVASPDDLSGIRRVPLSGILGNVAPLHKWSGKTIYLYGDSISSADYSWYADHLSARTGATVIRGGVSGATAAATATSARIAAVTAANADLVIYMPGGNDQGVSGTVGTFEAASGETVVTDPDPSVAYAGTKYVEAVAWTVRALNNALYSSGKKVVLANGLPQRRNNATLTEAWNNPANHARKANAVREVADRYHIPMIDTMRECGWDMYIEPFWVTPTSTTNNRGILTMDGLHPNSAGYARLSDVVAEFIKGV